MKIPRKIPKNIGYTPFQSKKIGYRQKKSVLPIMLVAALNMNKNSIPFEILMPCLLFWRPMTAPLQLSEPNSIQQRGRFTEVILMLYSIGSSSNKSEQDKDMNSLKRIID